MKNNKYFLISFIVLFSAYFIYVCYSSNSKAYSHEVILEDINWSCITELVDSNTTIVVQTINNVTTTIPITTYYLISRKDTNGVGQNYKCFIHNKIGSQYENYYPVIWLTYKYNNVTNIKPIDKFLDKEFVIGKRYNIDYNHYDKIIGIKEIQIQ